MAFIELPEEEYFTLKEKLKKVEDRIQDIKFDDEHNIEIMNDILQIIEGDNNEYKRNIRTKNK